MRIILAILTFFAVALAFAAPAQKQDTKTTIMVKRSQPDFSITLTSNPTTGYSWFLGRHPKMITPVSSKFYPPQKMMPGAPGKREWHFKLNRRAFVVPSVTRLRLYYMRPWDHSTAEAKTFWIVAVP